MIVGLLPICSNKHFLKRAKQKWTFSCLMYTAERLNSHRRIEGECRSHSERWSRARNTTTLRAIGEVEGTEYGRNGVEAGGVFVIDSAEWISGALSGERWLIWACKERPITWCGIREVCADCFCISFIIEAASIFRSWVLFGVYWVGLWRGSFASLGLAMSRRFEGIGWVVFQRGRL